MPPLPNPAEWAARHPLSPIHVDCTTTVMLKILDGKCKMSPEEKEVMARLYDAVYQQPGEKLPVTVHQLIAEARANPDEALLLKVYEQRLLAETAISRPVMKAFKAMLRDQGLLGQQAEIIPD